MPLLRSCGTEPEVERSQSLTSWHLILRPAVQLQAISPRDAGPRYTGMVDAATRMARADGIKSLWSGTGVNIVRSVVATSAVLTVRG
jgi:hypothetical protein